MTRPTKNEHTHENGKLSLNESVKLLGFVLGLALGYARDIYWLTKERLKR